MGKMCCGEAVYLLEARKQRERKKKGQGPNNTFKDMSPVT
jgi:hypothetical protein